MALPGAIAVSFKAPLLCIAIGVTALSRPSCAQSKHLASMREELAGVKGSVALADATAESRGAQIGELKARPRSRASCPRAILDRAARAVPAALLCV
jgi:hypothetical protein